MGQADDIKATILGAVKAPEEVKKLKESIASALEILTTPGQPHTSEEVTVYRGTPEEKVLTMWEVHDNRRYSSTHLDSEGTLWNFFYGSNFIIKKVDLVAMPALIVQMYIRHLEYFVRTGTP